MVIKRRLYDGDVLGTGDDFFIRPFFLDGDKEEVYGGDVLGNGDVW